MGGFLTEVFNRNNRRLVLAAVIAGIGGLLFGYDTGVISGALLYIKSDFHAGTFAEEAIVSSLLIGAVVGAGISGRLSDRAGRRRTTIISGCIYVLGALASAASQNTAELIVARGVLGLAVGTASFVSVQYIAELVPKRIRGGLTSFNQLMIVLGILLAYVCDFLLKDVAGNWRWMLGLGLVPGLVLAIGMAFMPASPRWLVEEGREDEARRSLERLGRRGEEIDEELGEIADVAREERQGWRDLWAPSLRPMVVVGVSLALFQQIVGVNTVIYYAPTILKFAGGTSSSAIADTLFVGLTNVVLTVVAVLLIDKVGRRPLLIVGTIGLTVALVGLALYFQIGVLRTSVPWLAVVFLVLYIGSFAVGLGPVFWLMISEIYPLRIRSAAMSAASMTNWVANFVVSVSFLTLVSVIGRPGTFWLYAVIGVVAVMFFVAKVPETKGRSLETIEHELGGSEDDLGGSGGGGAGPRPSAATERQREPAPSGRHRVRA